MTDVSELAGILAELSLKTSKPFDTSSFASRLRIQKSVYLLKALGCKRVQDYGFSFYFRGPYSPSLAKDYYEIEASNISPHSVSLNPAHIQIVKDCVSRGDAFLEAVATVHSIKSTNLYGKGETLETARRLKPQLASAYEEAWHYLRGIELV